MSRQSLRQQQHLTCPFCPFESHDLGILERHVQHLHADRHSGPNGTPQPSQSTVAMSDADLAQLLAFEEAGLPAELALSDTTNVPARYGNQNSERTLQNGQDTSHPSPGSEESWVQCACGERVHFLELDAHSDMHAQENINIEEPELPTKDVELSTLRSTAQEPLSDVFTSFSTSIPKSLRNHDQIKPSRPPPTHERRRGPSLKEIFLGTPASPKRKSAYTAVSSKIGKTKRLGVSPMTAAAMGC